MPPIEQLADPRAGRAAASEAWLRARGLPYFVAPRARATLLVARTAPFVALLASADVGRWMIDRTTISLDSSSPVAGVLLLVLAGFALVVLVATPTAAFLLSAEWIRTSPRGTTAAGALLIMFYVGVAPWLVGHPEPVAHSIRALCTIALAVLATWLGAGSLVSWVLRSAVRQLSAIGEMTSRALPLLMLVVVATFFSRTLWEVAAAMSTARLLGLVALFGLLGLCFIVPVTREETRGLEEKERPLHRLERVNIVAVLVLAQGLQVAIFSLLVWAFFVVLGLVVFSPDLLDTWLGPHRALAEVAGFRLPVDIALVNTATVLSCVSSLNFLISATTTANYRAAFYDPLVDDARRALDVRAAYLDSLRRDEAPEIVVERE